MTTRPTRRRAEPSPSFRCCPAWGCVLSFDRPHSPLALLVLLAACEIEEIGIPRTDAQVAVHSVLSASAPTQVVLLERTRNGTVAITAPAFEVPDPVLSDEGIAESNAIVTLTTPRGATLVAREDFATRGDGKG